ncbi:hypothetical protein [Nostoc sp.]|uniref:hypothetical protein n=1 Tax=Nostoc sp. TaxID=1180 RepID=UPI002FF5C1D1
MANPRAKQSLRILAMLWNFYPYCRKIKLDSISTLHDRDRSPKGVTYNISLTLKGER